MSLIIGAILISNKVLIQGESPAWMYRENPISIEDSGWRIFSGTEDDLYVENPSNFRTISADELIKIDDSLKMNLLAPVGSSFEKTGTPQKWEIVDRG